MSDGRSSGQYYTDIQRLEQQWQSEPDPLPPPIEKELERVAALPREQQQVYRETNERLHRRFSPARRLIYKLRVRHLTVRQLEELTGITKRQLSSWESRYVHAWAQTGPNGWRKFSIKDAINLGVIRLAKLGLGIPIERFGGEISRWIQGSYMVESLIIPFSRGKGLFLGFELGRGGIGRFWHGGAEDGVRDFVKATRPFFGLPLRPTFESILAKAKREDFEADPVKNGAWRFRVDGEWIDLSGVKI